MKIITSSLDQIAGLDIISSAVLIFMFLLFILIVFRIYHTRKKDIDKWSKLPLESEDTIDNSNIGNHY
ncbi:MAG: cbb3-type cytochrome c oxidase subunit 3 [Bacteroidales bacterium]|nr:cbb3-type cytochrome c oxidase subunit 3 [Bacteroidales bacterium]